MTDFNYEWPGDRLDTEERKVRKATAYGCASITCFILAALCLILLLSGCASREQYYAERYASMTAEEIEAAREGADVPDLLFQIWLDTPEVGTICIDGRCSTIVIN